MLANLLSQIKIRKEKTEISGKLQGKSFVLTGSLSSMSRDEAKEKLRSLGAVASESVSKVTNYVVAGENPGSKYDKAKKLGIVVLNEDEFRKLLQF